ncbi:two-component system, chemotaxis family, sensor kinase CheA [Andreprevotia lacus DSM 23236]|jgi:two-component system chemotaxis sensor kinase CheA|uniref:Chemotaxis protein CheA n=1 Tax=Andreprevotia lacus DSM 23236 TaxID=1121001 RepID=A0A1W1WZS6_9NEIS|nr:chemotaxis protein CheW [Andreprevotia lacus]SMC16948.1 two-component system, chemotaxis family, sensor kinase CheA [Andreprevotia lacus DSM 23236]
MTIDISRFAQTFFDEALEHLASMESLLLATNLNAPDPEDLNGIFRAAHSIKGGAATFGFSALAEITHILENQLDRVRKGIMPLRADMVDTFLETSDLLKGMVQTYQSGDEISPATTVDACSKLHALETGGTAAKGWHLQLVAPGISHERLAGLAVTLQGQGWRADPDFPRDHAFICSSQASAAELTAALGAILAPHEFVLRPFSMARAAPVPLQSRVADPGVHEKESGTRLFEARQSPGQLDLANDIAEEDESYGLFSPRGTLAAASFAASSAAEEDGPPVAAVPDGTRPPPGVPMPEAAILRTASASTESGSIRVSTEKVDDLMNLVGELVITQAMLSQLAGQLDPAINELLLNGIGQLERNTRELQEAAMSIRMMPISFVFNRFPRLVRDTASKLGKRVRLAMHGEQTELDRGLIEKLSDPLTHLVRNSLDHGIETAEVRRAKGKDEVGALTLRAFDQGGNVVIQVADDGAGLNRARILAKAQSQGMKVHDGMSDGEVWQLIFEPGFSTAETVTDVSGRGVGMDVVRRNIQAMGGRIDIETRTDIGTIITIRLPLTLAILEGMAVRVDGEVYVIPLAFIIESLQPSSNELRTVSGHGRVLAVREEYMPVVTLQHVFGGAPRACDKGLFVILEAELGKIALHVDELIGQYQVVIKSLETNFRKVDGLSGATIMGDGRVALIVDIESLVRIALGRTVSEAA